MVKVILYGATRSPPVRAVLLTLHELGLEYEFKEVNPQAGETKTAEFLKMNPQHTIPVLEDNGHYIWDSHAILAYLARKYGKTDSLYPKDFYLRAVVDQRLHFDSSVLGASVVKKFVSPNITREQKIAAVYEAFGFLEAFLTATGTYLAGDQLTIADLSILSSVSSIHSIVPVDGAQTPKLKAWLELMQKLPYYEEANEKGLLLLIEKFREHIAADQF